MAGYTDLLLTNRIHSHRFEGSLADRQFGHSLRLFICLGETDSAKEKQA